MKPLLALDCDGILSDWLGGCLDAVFEVTGKRYQRQEVSRWDPWLQFKLQPDQTAAVFAQVDTPGFCESLDVLPGAEEGFSALSKVADVLVVTTPWVTAPTWCFERSRWLSRKFGVLPGQIIHAAAKEYITADFFLDDNKANVTSWTEKQKHPGYLYDATYNQGGDLPRVYSLLELADIIGRSVEAA